MRKASRWKARVALHDYHGNFLYYVSDAQGAEMVERGCAIGVKDYRYGRLCTLRYQELEGAKPSSAAASAPMITFAEMGANVLVSRTARLPELDTRGRDCKHARAVTRDPKRPAEDFVEQAKNKIRMWNVIPLLNPQHSAWT